MQVSLIVFIITMRTIPPLSCPCTYVQLIHPRSLTSVRHMPLHRPDDKMGFHGSFYLTVNEVIQSFSEAGFNL